MSKEQLNFKVLRKPNSPDFLDEMDKAPLCLQSNEAAHFYKILLSHFESDINPELGNKILMCIAKILTLGKFTETFISENFVLALPFTQKKYSNPIFEILKILLEQSMDFFDEDLVHQFESLISNDPDRSLTIIALYSKDFANLDNPFPMIDLIFQHPDEFQTPELVFNYVSLITYLYKSYLNFRQKYGKTSWITLCSMLKKFRDDTSLNIVYSGLCMIADEKVKVKLPLDSMKKHIQHESLRENILSLCLHKSPNFDEEFAELLEEVAKTNKKATLVILSCCSKSFSNAEIIFFHLNELFSEGGKLPTMSDTIRILFCLLKFQDLCDRFPEISNLLDFLLQFVQNDNKSIKKSQRIQIICQFLTNIKPDVTFVISMNKSSFLRELLATSKTCNEESSDRAVLELFLHIAPYAYVPEYLKICDIISREIMNNGRLSELAFDVAEVMCKHQQCVNRMKETNLVAFYEKNKNDRALHDQAESFLALIGWNDQSDGDNNDY